MIGTFTLQEGTSRKGLPTGTATTAPLGKIQAMYCASKEDTKIENVYPAENNKFPKAFFIPYPTGVTEKGQ
jgi:hypothetical protein